VHPNLVGAAVMGNALYGAMTPLYGTREFTLHADNVLTNHGMAGNGGTVVGSIFTGVLADSWASSGSGGGSGDAQLAKDGNGKQTVTFSSATVATFSRRLQWTHTAGSLPGKTCYFEAEIEVLGANAGTGTWYTMSVEIRNIAELSVGFDRRNNTDKVADTQLMAFQAAQGRRLIMRTPVVVAPDPTASLTGRVNLELINGSGQSCNAQITVHNAQLVVSA
jgi:hypothetical protein